MPAKAKMKEVDAGGKAYRRLGGKTLAAYDGKVNVAEWDDEELMRGYQKDKDGRFTGRAPRIVPRECYNEFARRKLAEFNQRGIENVNEVLDSLITIANSNLYDERARVQAAKVVLERMLGKPLERLDVNVTVSKWEGVMQAGSDFDDEILEAEVIEEDDDDFIEDAS